MSTPIRAATFVLALAVVFAAALGIGRLAGPLDTAVASHESDHADEGEHGADHAAAGSAAQAATESSVAGLQTSEGGYTLELADGRVRAGRQPISFTITGPDRAPVTAYDEQHERDLHLIVVRRDLTGFQHVHPTLDADTGTWSVDGIALEPGAWRVIADFRPTGAEAQVLGTDLLVAGEFDPAAQGPDARVVKVSDYQVVLNGDLTTGESKLTLQVSKDGNPLTDLQPYLGAYGHLVAMRAGDLGYLHVHPNGVPGETPAGPDIVFHTEFPSDGRYRLFLDFRHQGVVRTAAFTVTVGGDGSGVAGDSGDSGEHGEGGDHDH